jgi:hypothetical protein
VTAELVVVVPGRPPTPNARRHWRTRSHQDKHWRAVGRQAAADAVEAAGWTTPSFAHVLVTFILPDRRDRDEDNLISAQKPCLDGIVDGGAIAGDGHRHIRRSYDRRLVRGVTATEYRIIPIEPEQQALSSPAGLAGVSR